MSNLTATLAVAYLHLHLVFCLFLVAFLIHLIPSHFCSQKMQVVFT